MVYLIDFLILKKISRQQNKQKFLACKLCESFLNHSAEAIFYLQSNQYNIIFLHIILSSTSMLKSNIVKLNVYLIISSIQSNGATLYLKFILMKSLLPSIQSSDATGYLQLNLVVPQFTFN